MNEIGSEFWSDVGLSTCDQHVKSNNTIYLLSGRTALDYIVRDIKASKPFSSIAMPSYCCESMVEPFLRNVVGVEFYDVGLSDGGIMQLSNIPDSTDAVLLLDFFGYANPELPRIAEQAKAAGETVIYDGTHKLNGHPAVEAVSDYTFCSYRKWFYSNAARVSKNTGVWNLETALLSRNSQYEALRNKASELKREYIDGENVDKSEFLSRFSEAEEMLDHDYISYAAEPESVERMLCTDIAFIAEKRCRNAQRLIDGLVAASMPWIKVPIKTVKPEDCPLFVPVLVEPSLRSVVRQKLIEQNIYCPIHWPLVEQHYICGIEQHDQYLYQTELSLVCDQRYDLTDVDRIVETLKAIGDTI